MPPPRDRMAAMQQQAYLEDDDFHMDMNDEHDPAMQEFFRQIEVWKFFEKNKKGIPTLKYSPCRNEGILKVT